jgi:hypothetical protein
MQVNKPTALVISPDGRDVFVTGYCCAHAFAALRRSLRTGALGRAVCCDSDPRAVTIGYDVAVSPDGRNVYVASAEGTGHGLAVLDRDPTTGQLTQPDGTSGCIQRIGAGGCDRAPTTSFAPSRVVVSGDGASVYVVSNGSMFAFARNPSTGALSAGPCFEHAPNPPCRQLPVLISVTDMGVSSDQRNLYVLGRYGGGDSTRDAIVGFTRGGADSSLDAVPGPGGCVIPIGGTDNCQRSQGLARADFDTPQWGSPRQLVGTADGRALFLTQTDRHGRASIITFARDPTPGTLSQDGGSVWIRSLPGDGALGTTAFPSADGRFLYVGEEGDIANSADALFLYRASD